MWPLRNSSETRVRPRIPLSLLQTMHPPHPPILTSPRRSQSSAQWRIVSSQRRPLRHQRTTKAMAKTPPLCLPLHQRRSRQLFNEPGHSLLLTYFYPTHYFVFFQIDILIFNVGTYIKRCTSLYIFDFYSPSRLSGAESEYMGMAGVQIEILSFFKYPCSTWFTGFNLWMDSFLVN